MAPPQLTCRPPDAYRWPMADETPPVTPSVTYDTAALADRMTMFVPHAAALGMTLISTGKGKGMMSLAWREDLVGELSAPRSRPGDARMAGVPHLTQHVVF